MKKLTLILLCGVCACAGLFADLTLRTVTTDGFVFVSDRGNERLKPLPTTVVIPTDAHALTWDAETLTLSWKIITETSDDAGEITRTETPATATLTGEQIATARNYVAPPPVPQRVSKAQFKLALLGSGIDIEALILALAPADQPAARVLYNNSDYFTRTAAMVAKLGFQAELTSEQLDDLFRAAAQIDPTKI
tara:strand:+ start:1898 stop:2476 length:579 start_codon:yes stop_codon:yes gene_type:complete